MRIDAAGEVAGLPALQAREFVRVTSAREPFTREEAATVLGWPERRVARFIKALEAAGFLTPGKPYSGARTWELTLQGYGLRNATAAKPITRATADRLVREAIARAQALADWAAHPYAHRVRELLVFGSYLASPEERPTVNDVDLAVAWEDRYPERGAQMEYERERTRVARRAGRTFSNISEEYMWPYVEAHRALRGRSAAMSLHDLGQMGDFVRARPHRVLFRLEPAGTPS